MSYSKRKHFFLFEDCLIKFNKKNFLQKKSLIKEKTTTEATFRAFFITYIAIYTLYSSTANAELSYNFTQKKATNGIKQTNFFKYITDIISNEKNVNKKKTINSEKEKIATNDLKKNNIAKRKKNRIKNNNFNNNIINEKKNTNTVGTSINTNNNNINNINSSNSNQIVNNNGNSFYNRKNKKVLFGDSENEIKLNIGGLGEVQYFNIDQAKPYKQDILPNNLPYSPSTIHNYSIYNNNNNNVINMLGRIDINPEFIHYNSNDDNNNIIKKKKIITVGAKLSQPFYNASKNTDPRLAPQEYIYAKTDFFSFQMGAVNSSASSMRVDAQKIASGAGGIYGTWWRYISLPVFDTSELSGDIINAVSPTYMLYPTLPNEAGFTVQRTSVGEPMTSGNIQYRANAQGYPTQGAYSNKISVYMNRIKGFSVGVSYSPTTAHTGYIVRGLNQNTSTFANITGGFVKNYTSVAIDYRKQFDKHGIGIAASVTYEHGQTTPASYVSGINNTTKDASAQNTSSYNLYDRHNLNAFAVGAQLVYRNYSLAYSYGYWGRSMMQKTPIINIEDKFQIENHQKASYYHTAGFGANYGPIRLGATYMRSSLAGYKLDAWSIGTDYKIISLRSLKVQSYVEYVGYIFHTQDVQVKTISGIETRRAIKNNGYVITAGLRILF